MKVFNQALKSDHKQSAVPTLKVLLGLFLLIGMVSQGRLDPSPLNLLRPAEGIENWFGLPGALAAGFLRDLFGICGFLAPLSIIFLKHNEKLKSWQAVLLDTALIVLLTIGLAQFSFSPNVQPALSAGLLGAIANVHLHQFPGKLITLLVVAGFSARYIKHYQFNRHFFTMIGQLGALLTFLAAYLD